MPCPVPFALPARACKNGILRCLDDKVLFARRLHGTGLHPPTVVLEGDDLIDDCLLKAESVFDSALWFVKHRSMGGGSRVYCVRGKTEALALLHELSDPRAYVLQANVKSKLFDGRKCSIRCFGAFFKGMVFYLSEVVIVKVHGTAYSESSTNADIHSLCYPFNPKVQAISGDEFFAHLSANGQGSERSCADDLHSCAQEVLKQFREEARLVPDGEYCLIGLDLLLCEGGGAICIEANYPCAINERSGSSFAVLKTKMRRELKRLLEGSTSGFSML
eukprot:TRINITY_DN92167_c0_g1_i1.p1 TRINITY_DN92167_c0_g1~~TRINITY_DN92167_c0_g1_i1.p1  ORF type:complete len:276 (-),score=25.34 TRINITY_DN92167_c0_g1_i1:225-1052(-)